MDLSIRMDEILIDQIVYDHKTSLFPFSPRLKVEPWHVKRLKASIREMGLWQPIIVRAETLEGIAGNHRFLAILELLSEKEVNLKTAMIRVMLVDCDEGTAVAIALAENEVRENLTQSESIRALVKVAGKTSKFAETVFNVDGETAQQLSLWGHELDYGAEIQERSKRLQSQLTRDWVQMINHRLANYPDLRAQFLHQLGHPSWVQAQSLGDLDHAITVELLHQGVHFDVEHTWNAVPTQKCTGCAIKFDEFRERIANGDIQISTDGTVPNACPHLRIFTKHTEQFIPDPTGTDLLPRESVDMPMPTQMPTPDNLVRGWIVNLLDTLDAYCVDPAVGEPGSCFHEREAEAAQSALDALRSKILPAMLPQEVQRRKHAEEFIWLEPIMDGQTCSPSNCLHRQDDPPGFALIAEKNNVCRMACLHADCGGKAKLALETSEAQQRQREKERYQAALSTVRQKTVEQTLLLQEDQLIALTHPTVLGIIESLAVPDWDKETMTHVVLGWQLAMYAQVAAEIGLADQRRITAALRERIGDLADRPSPDTILHQFKILRAHVIESYGLQRWVTCLTLAHGWKDHRNKPEALLSAKIDLVDVLKPK